MKKNGLRIFTVSLVFFTAVLPAFVSGAEALTVLQLRCEYRRNPLGIDAVPPRLSWRLHSGKRNEKQTAYHILVARTKALLEEGKADLWDSGKVTSSRSINVVYKGVRLTSGITCFWKVRVWDRSGAASKWSKAASWEMGLLKQDDWKGEWIGDGKPVPDDPEAMYKDDPAPFFRREFSLEKEVESARLYISGLGYYEAYIHGARLGRQVLDPAWTVYDKRVFYSTYDVTAKLLKGENCIAVELGNGWYNLLPLRMWGHLNIRKALATGRPRFIAQLNITYADGSRDSVVSDGSWQVADGPIIRNSIYLGEVYDARKEKPGWKRPGYDASGWKKATPVEAPGGKLCAQPLPPIRERTPIFPAAVTACKKGVYIFDMGQNFAGWVRLKVTAPRGTVIRLRYGELLNKDGSLNPMTSVCGQIKGRRTRKDGTRYNVGGPGSPEIAWQADTYIAKGEGEEIYAPRFTFHAFRYVEMSGYPGTPDRGMIKGYLLSSHVDDAGNFRCSNKRFNAIQKMCRWTFLSNIFSVQSDCPHRERFGYGGDLVTTSDAFMLNFDMAGFYAKVVNDWTDAALENGMFTDTAPFVGIQYCGVGWAMAQPLLQLQLYQYYGNRRLIEEHYEAACRWFDLVEKQHPDHIIKKGLSDHEGLEKAPSGPMVTPLYAESARILARLSTILGKEKEAARYTKLVEKIKTAYREKFLEKGTGRVEPHTQAGQSFALFLDMLPQEEKKEALKVLLDYISKRGDHLSTGIFGTKYMLDVLSRNGHADTAFQIVNQDSFPGWGWMLENGATTLWEHWALSTNTFSHNHPMFGSVSQWFFNWLGGIQVHPDAYACDRVILRPQFVETLDWVHCRYPSIRGTIESRWERHTHGVALKVFIPVGVTADLVLPADAVEKVAEGAGITILGKDNGTVVYRLGSGYYDFLVNR